MAAAPVSGLGARYGIRYFAVRETGAREEVVVIIWTREPVSVVRRCDGVGVSPREMIACRDCAVVGVVV